MSDDPNTSDISNPDSAEIDDIENEVDVSATEVPLTKKEKFKKEFKSISLIIFIVLIFRSIFFEPFRIPSGSMIPTLMIGDFILVNKMSYGFKVPFSDVFSDPVYIFGKSNPANGDVIVFKFPKNPSMNYIKRVIGVPGDTVEIKNKRVFVNGKKLDGEEITNSTRGKEIWDDMDVKFKEYNLRFFKTKTGEEEHVVQIDSDNYYKLDFEKITVPEGKFFVMGDNRDFSYDSRYWGFVPHENIKGEALFVWFSMILPFSDHPVKFRPWRIGTPIN